MKTFLIATSFFLIALVRPLPAQSGDQPAMIGAGPDSVASKLHYPAAAKASKAEAAVQFYCEVTAEGHVRHLRIITADQRGPFRSAVEKAVQQGRFSPARAGGKPTTVLIGGTVLFVQGKEQPVIVVSLCTTDKQKAASGENYIQPQMAMTYAELERKTILYLRSAALTGGGTPNADIGFEVDANGAMTRSWVINENPKGMGDVLLKACAGAKFIPAVANGKRVAGKFNLAVDLRMMNYPDQEIGSHLRPREQ